MVKNDFRKVLEEGAMEAVKAKVRRLGTTLLLEGARVGIHPVDLSKVTRGKVADMSSDKLASIIEALGYRVECKVVAA